MNNLIDDFLDSKDSASTDDEDVDVWAPSFNAEESFEVEALAEIKEFWKSNADEKGLLSRSAFMGWKDIQDLISEGVVSKDDLDKIWDEAFSTMKKKMKDMIDYDTFLRMNVRIDLMIDDEEDEGQDGNAADDSESGDEYYAKVFREISGNKKVLALSDLFKWSELQDLIDESFLTTKSVIEIYEKMPQTVDENNNKGISVRSFIALNTMLDVLIDKSNPGGSQSTSSKPQAKTASSIPTALVAEGARPLPQERELKIGSLNEKDGKSTGEITTEELELMNALDKAESLLNTGSFQVSCKGQ